MRCSNCGLPLSPSRTSCPRCGTIYHGSSKKVRSEQETLSPQAGEAMPVQPNMQSGHVETGTQYPQWNAYPASSFQAAPAGYPVEASQQLSPASDKDVAFFDFPPAIKDHRMPHQIPQQVEQSWFPATSPQALSQSSAWTATPPPLQPFPQAMYTSAAAHTQRNRRRSMRIGFAAAGICIITGALILTFVSIIAQPLLSTNTRSVQTKHTNTTHTPSGTVIPSPTAPTPTATPTPLGTQYITNAMMASKINESTGQATQYTTNFTVNQRIYVTFALNTGYQGGAVCIRWYLNNQHNSDYAFPVAKNQFYNSYAYTSMSNPGNGYVEVSWASTVACTDEALAQHATFTIS